MTIKVTVTNPAYKDKFEIMFANIRYKICIMYSTILRLKIDA